MRLRRVRLQDYRGIEACDVELLPAGATTGVTVVEGPNEVGKTSLAEAIRLLFDFPHSSRHRDVRTVQPQGRDVGSRIELDVDGGGISFTYVKVFNRDARAELTVRGDRSEQLTGKRAHERARQLLADLVDIDFWQALQVQQGVVAQADVANSPVLAAALARGGGHAVVDERDARVGEALTAERDRWRTSTGRDRAALTDAAAEVARLQRERDEVRAVLDTLRAELWEIERLRAGMPERRSAVTASSRELAALGEELSRLDDLAERARDLHRATEVARSFDRHARDALAARAELLREVDEASRAAAVAAERVGHGSELASLREALAAAEGRAEAARAAARRAAGDLRRAQARCDRLRDERRLAELLDRLERVTAVSHRLAEAEHAMARCAVDEHTLADLRQAEEDLVRARAALTGAGATITVTALAAARVRLGDEAADVLTAGRVTTADAGEPLAVVVGDVAAGDLVRIDVDPGHGAEELAAAVRHATQRRTELLRVAGFDDIAAAAAAVDALQAARRDHAAAMAERAGLLGHATPSDLESEVAAVRARLAASETDADDPSSARGPSAADADGDPDAARLRRDALQQEAQRADAELQAAMAEVEGLRSRLSRHEQERQRVHTDARVAASAHAQLAARLERQRAESSDEELAREAARREQELDEAAAADRGVRRQLEAADPDSLRERAASLQSAVTIAAEALREDERRLAALEAAVAARSAEGPRSRLDDIEARLGRAESTLTRLRRRADAAELAERVFLERREEQRRRYLTPLADQITQLGRILWGSSFAVELDEELRVRTRVLDGESLPFDQLSMGAQEQLALIGRLACAIVVGPGGAPLLIDDALGFSDPDRLRRMGAVLAVAGRSCQIVVLTCHPQRYLHVTGARTVRMRPGSGDRASAAA